MSKPKCDTCGGEDFFTDAGFFYCKECQTQSQDIREEVLDDFFTGQRGTVRTLKKPSLHDRSLIAGEDLGLTSWEIFNYVLKGLVDELIKLGSKQELKIITLQLWASYLYKLEVAFTSSNISRKPKLSLNFKLKDAEIIYGVAKERVLSDSLLRNKRKKRVSMNSGSEASSTSVISKRAAAKKASSAKKALVKAEYEETFSSVNDSFSEDISNQTLESLASSSSHSPQPVKSHKIKLTKHARDLLQKNRIKLARMKREKDKMNYRRNILRKQLTTVHNLTLAKIVALLRLALIFCKEDIYIGDILRWIAEGHLSVNKCEKFIPEEAKIPLETQRVLDPFSISQSGQQATLMNLCSALEIDELPIPDLCELAKRYCLELQLPDDFSSMAQSWIANTPLKLITMETKFETRTMAYIIMLLKMIFSLDGVTENKLSELALEVNRSPMRNGEKTLFVWTDWMEYIECRKDVVSSFHHVTRQSVYSHYPGQDSTLFLDHYEQTMFKIATDNLKTGISEDWRNAVKRTLDHLDIYDTSDTEIICFPPTLTPLYSYCQLLMTSHQTKLSNKAKSILSQEFTKHSTNFLFNPKSSISLGAVCDLNILPQVGIANTCVVEEFAKIRDTIENVSINKTNMRVEILTKINRNVKKQATKDEIDLDVKKDELNLAEIVSDDSSDEEDDFEGSETVDDLSGGLLSLNESSKTIPLYETRHNYWICHKKLESNEEFSVFAAEVFPSSFLWLLKECARTVGVTIRDLYEEVMYLERRKTAFTKSNSILRKRKKLFH